MKGAIRLFTITCFFLFTAFAGVSSAQESASVKEKITGKLFTFKAQTAIPATGFTRQLTSEYDVKLTGGRLDVYLPYFGRAYAAPVDPSKSALHFTSTDFDYTSLPGKRGGWNIKIRPHDNREVNELNFSISSKGYGSLNVTSNNRQPISFSGYIDKAKKNNEDL